MRCPLPLLLMLTMKLAAQQVWVVDEMFGAGADTRDIPSAVQMAAEGDKILVRPGRYSATMVQSKSLTIVGEPGAEVRPSATEPGFGVIQLSAQQRVTIRGFSVQQRLTGGAAGIFIDSNQGSVHLEALRVVQTDLVGLQIRDSVAVSLLDVQVGTGLPNAEVVRSTVAMSHCTLTATNPGDPGLFAENATVVLTDCSLRGADVSASVISGPGNGLEARNCTVTLGHARTSIVAGLGSGANARPTAAVRMTGGTLVYDPAIALQPSHGGAPIDATGTSVLAQVVATLGRQTPSQGILSPLEVRGRAGDATFTLVSLPHASLPTPFGRAFVDPIALLLVDAGILDASGGHAFTLPRPPVSLGTPLVLQALLLGPANALALSTPLTMSY